MDSDRTFPVFAQKCNLKDGGISLEQARFLDPSTINKWGDEYKLVTGDILVNSTGTGTVGRTCLFHKSCLKDYPFVVPDSHVSVVRTTKNIFSDFVYAYLSTNQARQYMEDNLAGSTNQKELYIGVLENINIPIPPLSEQYRIVAEIERLFSLINQIEQGKTDLQTIIKQTKSKILDLAIHGKLVPQDPNDESAIDLLRRINPNFKPCDNAHYKQLPKSWDIIHLGDICQLADGEVTSITELPYLDVKSLRNQTYITKDSGKFIKAGTTLILIDGENSGEVFHAIVDGYQGSTMKILNINSNINQLYVLNFIKLHQKALRENKVGSAIPHLNKKMFRELMIPIPPIAQQNRIVKEVDRYNKVIDKIIAEL